MKTKLALCGGMAVQMQRRAMGNSLPGLAMICRFFLGLEALPPPSPSRFWYSGTGRLGPEEMRGPNELGP